MKSRDLPRSTETQCEDQAFDRLLDELVELRRATAEVVGRQYLYGVLDDAVESGHLESLQRARAEIDEVDDDVRQRLIVAAGFTT